MKKLLDTLYDHYFLTILMVLVGLALFVAITIKVFFDPVAIPEGTADAYIAFFAVFGLTLSLWKWRRSRDDSDGGTE